MRTVEVASIGYQGMIYVFPAAEDGSIQIIAATSSGSAVRVVLDRQATQKLASHLNEEVICATQSVGSGEVCTDCHNTEAQLEAIDGASRYLAASALGPFSGTIFKARL